MSEACKTQNGISILILAYHPDMDDIKQILTALSSQTCDNFEIIVANDGDDFFTSIKDYVATIKFPFQYKQNEKRLGLYFSIKENIQYCHFENILILEQDIIPLSRDYVKSLAELLQSCPSSVITSRLFIDVGTSYKKYIFYKRRISNLEIIDHDEMIDNCFSNDIMDAEVTFTKADLLNKQVLEELFATGSVDTNTAQDIILSSIVRRSRRLITSNATACEIGRSDPNDFDFFFKKEFLYGKSTVDAWRYSDKGALLSTSYFKEKIFRILFVLAETIIAILCSFELLIRGSLALPLLATIFGLGILYTQVVYSPHWFLGFSAKNSAAAYRNNQVDFIYCIS